ncbi:lactonase family protein [Alkalibacterium sp.]|nr:MAG: lactonase family protein [Alkalibacterium sp.]
MKQTILLGTYTKRESKGVYSIQLDTQSKQLESLAHEASIGHPTYIDGSADMSLLFSVSKTTDGKGGVASFVKDDDGNYEKKAELLEDGAPPCYVSYDPDKNLVYTANYHKGEVAVYQTNSEGTLKLLDKAVHSGKSVHENQDAPHAHYFDLTPDHRFLVACDLGTDKVYTYELDENNKLQEKSVVEVAPGTGPRHLTFHPNGQFAYVFGELSSDMLVFEYDKEKGSFSHLQTLSTIPDSHSGFNGGAALRITSDGSHLYASNRGHNSIVHFAVQPDGKLDRVGFTATEGEIPRDFNMTPDDNFLIIGHQDTDNLSLFERNSEDGTLSLLQKDIYAPEVVCVQFAE